MSPLARWGPSFAMPMLLAPALHVHVIVVHLKQRPHVINYDGAGLAHRFMPILRRMARLLFEFFQINPIINLVRFLFRLDVDRL